MRLNIKLILLVLICASAVTLAQAPESLLTRLQGSWQGAGKSFGMDAQLQLKWEWVLEKKFLRLSLRNEMRASSTQTQLFEGHAYYQAAGADKFEARWFDSRGVSFPIKANSEGNALVALWGTPDQEQGRSTYRLLESGKLEVTDEVLQKDGSWKEFGRFVLTRQ